MSKDKVLVLGGATGLLGQALAKALKQNGHEVTATGRLKDKLINSDDLRLLIETENPGVVFNAIAYTQVDKAEEDSTEAYLINKSLPSLLGKAAKDAGVYLVHFSTDFVFDGKKQAPYTTEDEPNPVSVYGQSKLAGEKALLELDMPRLLIVRSAWLFGPGKTNFVKKMLELAKKQDLIRVVHDQMGSPTYTPDLAAYTLKLVKAEAVGLFHVVNGGQASWCELAAEAIRAAGLDAQVQAISTEDYPTPAKRPQYSVLDTGKFAKVTGIKPRPWLQAVQEYVFTMTHGKKEPN